MTWPAAAHAQAPFITDDASVTPRGGWHLEIYEQFAALRPLDLPAVRQHTLVFSAMRGVLPWLELGIDFPLLHIENQGIDNEAGLGDLNFVAKFRLRDADEAGWLPAFYGTVQVEVPTGDAARSLGTGETDVVVNAIAERTLANGVVLRGNLGAVLTGNSLTGVVGLSRNGFIAVASGAVGVRVHPRFLLLAELSYAQARYPDDRDKEFRAQLGGWWRLSDRSQIGVAYQAGWYATPGHQVQVGWSVDY
ncbi:MAG: hypothetical protein HY275_11655 [Gemmatimonadetes bacterium]|nr:hypothetical protein [Gemmatimonadota bacterium]